MKAGCLFIFINFLLINFAKAQSRHQPVGLTSAQQPDSVKYIYKIGEVKANDSTPTINLREVEVIAFRNPADWNQYYTYKARILKVMPYVKIARELYAELQDKEENSRKRDYRHYRKDLEKEMRAKFEKELKDLTTGQGEMLFKLINRETGNNCYSLIKEVKGGFLAWFYQTVARRWGYNLKDNYDPEQEKMIELIIKELGPAYKV
jgi:hypothetical protein